MQKRLSIIQVFTVKKLKIFFNKKKDILGDSVGHFNTIIKLESFLRINEVYTRENNKKEFRSEFSLDLKFTSLDSR